MSQPWRVSLIAAAVYIIAALTVSHATDGPSWLKHVIGVFAIFVYGAGIGEGREQIREAPTIEKDEA